MTLIAGFNLSNRLYLVSDTRVTIKPSNEYRDNINKTGCIWGKSISPQSFYDDNWIYVAVAGNLEFATYFVNEVRVAIGNKELSSDIRILKDQIESFAIKVVNSWTLDLNKGYRDISVIFGGVNNKIKKKKIDLKIFKNLFHIYIQKFIKKTMMEKPCQKHYSEKVWIPSRFKSCVESDHDILTVSDSLIFSVKIDMRSPVSINTAEWGQFVDAGSFDLTNKEIPDLVFANLEFEEKLQNHLEQGKILGSIWAHIFHKEGVSGIGGTILTQIVEVDISTGESKIIVANTTSDDGKLFVIDRGQKLELIDFNNYERTKQFGLDAEI